MGRHAKPMTGARTAPRNGVPGAAAPGIRSEPTRPDGPALGDSGDGWRSAVPPRPRYRSGDPRPALDTRRGRRPTALAAPGRRRSVSTTVLLAGVRFIKHIPLLPAFVGMLALAYVVLQLSTRDITLSFTSGSVQTPHSAAAGVPQNSVAPGTETGQARTVAAIVQVATTSKTAGGFTGTMIIINTGSMPLAGWRLSVRFPAATVLAVTDVRLTTEGQDAILTAATGTPTLPPGKSVRISFTATGTPSGPSECTINGSPCRH